MPLNETTNEKFNVNDVRQKDTFYKVHIYILTLNTCLMCLKLNNSTNYTISKLFINFLVSNFLFWALSIKKCGEKISADLSNLWQDKINDFSFVSSL